MTQLRMFKEETKKGTNLLKSTYKLHLAVLKLTYSHTIALSILKDNFKDYYFSIDRHNKMIGEWDEIRLYTNDPVDKDQEKTDKRCCIRRW